MNTIFDLDGTLIDSKQRLYKLFQHLTPESELTYNAYWEFKERKISNQMILENLFTYTKNKIEIFLENWMFLIEDEKYLALDTPVDNIHATLASLQDLTTLYICTARQNIQKTQEQLESLQLLQFFEKVLVTEQKFSKEILIRQAIPRLNITDWMVGDTGKDIEVGKILGIKTCAVSNGFLSKTVLSDYEPDLIIETAAEFNTTILKR